MNINIKQIYQQQDNNIRQTFLYNQWAPHLIYRDICALANSLRYRCGYILIGASQTGLPDPNGLTASQIDIIKKEMAIYNKLIKPSYEPELHICGTIEKPVALILIKPTGKGPYAVPEDVRQGVKNYRRYLIFKTGIIVT